MFMASDGLVEEFQNRCDAAEGALRQELTPVLTEAGEVDAFIAKLREAITVAIDLVFEEGALREANFAQVGERAGLEICKQASITEPILTAVRVFSGSFALVLCLEKTLIPTPRIDENEGVGSPSWDMSSWNSDSTDYNAVAD